MDGRSIKEEKSQTFITMMKAIIVLFFFVLTVSSKLLENVGKCDSKNVYQLDPGDMLFVESSDFPKSLTTESGKDIDCAISVSRKDGQKKGLQFVFTNGHTSKFKFSTSDGDVNLPFE